jgi:NAD(P)-dependent dehydrogenase (short-subunit alcohol dehydrogenase family)
MSIDCLKRCAGFHMKISGSTVLVTEASRGLSRHFARQLLDRGTARVYATARDTSQVEVSTRRSASAPSLRMAGPRSYSPDGWTTMTLRAINQQGTEFDRVVFKRQASGNPHT